MAISRTGVLALVDRGRWSCSSRPGTGVPRYNVMARRRRLVVGLVCAAARACSARSGRCSSGSTRTPASPAGPTTTRSSDTGSRSGRWLGRGPGTLIPDLYLILDNQWLLTLVTGGHRRGGRARGPPPHVHLRSPRSPRCGGRPAPRTGTCARRSSLGRRSSRCWSAVTFDSFSFTTFSFTLALCLRPVRCGVAVHPSGPHRAYVHGAAVAAMIRWMVG